MPKSRFNARNQSGSNHRHNPLSGSVSGSRSASSSNTAAPSKSSPLAAQSSTSTSTVIPVLSKLPLPPSTNNNQSNPTSNPTDADLLWALSSVSVLLTSRNSRRSLLNPQHRLPSRILYALKLQSSSNSLLEVRREATGALRNLCIEAARVPTATNGNTSANGNKLAEIIVSEKGIQLVIDQLIWVAGKSGIIERDPKVLQEEKLEALQLKQKVLGEGGGKPVDQMNRKEKRQLAKLSKSLGSGSESVQMEIEAPKVENGNESMTSEAQEKEEQDKEILDEKLSLNLLAENCIITLWCLIESTTSSSNSSQALQNLNERSPLISKILSSIVSNGSKVLSELGSESSLSDTKEEDSSLLRRSNQLKSSTLNLSFQALNTLCSLSEMNTPFSIAFLGLSEDLLASQEAKKDKNNKKSSVKSKISKPAKTLFMSPPDKKEGAENLRVLIEIIGDDLQNQNLQVDEKLVELKHYSEVFSVTSCSIIRNLLHSLPKSEVSQITINLPASISSTPSEISLQKFERSQIFNYLMALLERKFSKGSSSGSRLLEMIRDLEDLSAQLSEKKKSTPQEPSITSQDPEKIVEALNKSSSKVKPKKEEGEEEDEDEEDEDRDEESPLSIKLKRAEELVSTNQLGMEILAEIMTELPGGGDDEEEREVEEWLEQEIDDEDEEEEGMGMDEEMMDADEDQETDIELGDKTKNEDEDEMMLDHGIKTTSKPITTASSTALTPSPLTNLISSGFITRVLNLSNTLSLDLPLSFPDINQTSTTYASSNQLRSFLLRILSILSNFLLNFSRKYSPPPPSTPLIPDSPQEAQVKAFRSWSRDGKVYQEFKNCWIGSFEMAGKLASLENITHTTSISSPGIQNGESKTSISREKLSQENQGRLLIESHISNLWSISRLFEGSDLPLALTPSSTPNEIPLALQNAYQSSTSDSMRVKCLSTLSCLARSEKVEISLNEQIGLFFIEVLKGLNGSTNPKESGSGKVEENHFTTAESMVAVLDGIFDVYADENSRYDREVFRKHDFKGKLRGVWGKVRAEVSNLSPLMHGF